MTVVGPRPPPNPSSPASTPPAALTALAAAVARRGRRPGRPGPRAATSTTTTTSPTTPRRPRPAPPAPSADQWLLKAIGAEANSAASVSTARSTRTSLIYLDLVVNGDGEGGGTFIQDGFSIQLERVGPVLYFNAPKKYWAKHSSATQASAYGGKWLEISALDPRFVSFDQFLDADDLVFAAFDGHTTPLTVGKTTTYQGHRVVIVKESVVANGKKHGLHVHRGHRTAHRLQDHQRHSGRREHDRLLPLRQGGHARPSRRTPSTSPRPAAGCRAAQRPSGTGRRGPWPCRPPPPPPRPCARRGRACTRR